jgi:TatD DNase family protein
MYFIDTHTHLSMIESEANEVISAAEKENIRQFVNIGTNHEDHPEVLMTAQKYFPKVFCTLGVHPHDAKNFELAKDFMLKNLHQKEVIAVGEIGLDYYYLNSDAETQKDVFRKQLQMALDHNLPIEIHTRDAEEDTINILKEFRGQVKGLIHCFTGTQFLADEALNLGLNISISGVVTFKTAEPLRDVVRTLPLDRIHLETDAPFLAPMPHRGKKNQPAFMIETAKKVAELKQVSLEDLAKQVQKNTEKLFSKLVFL